MLRDGILELKIIEIKKSQVTLLYLWLQAITISIMFIKIIEIWQNDRLSVERRPVNTKSDKVTSQCYQLYVIWIQYIL